jgi:predicted TIM-barrel fold metal-dependent hydrolase
MREIIDFHTHPFLDENDSICIYKRTTKTMPDDLSLIGIDRFCGSVITYRSSGIGNTRISNDTALALREKYGNRYIPGFMVHPNFPEDSIEELKKAKANGIRLIGELVPYAYKWQYDSEGFYAILDYTDNTDFIYSMHTTDIEVMRKIAKEHKATRFVFAHPGEASRVEEHISVMLECDNVYLDISGTGLFRYGMLKHLVTSVGADRIIFGSDYPICNPNMYIHAVEFEKISDSDKELIFSQNAKRLLNI